LLPSSGVVFQQLLELGFVGLAAVPDGRSVASCSAGSTFPAPPWRCCSAGELAVLVVHVGHAAAHAGREVAAGLAQHHHGAAGHVFAAVVARAFDHRRGARQAHGKALAGHAAEEGLTAGGAVHHGVADDDVAGASPRNSMLGRTTTRPPDRPLPV
jgi:hypothetical protein